MSSPSTSSEPPSSEPIPVTLPGAVSMEITTRRGAAYRIFIWRPAAAPPPAGYPVTYLLDGNAVFATAVDIARLTQMGFGPKRRSPGAIVAIGYPGETPIEPARRTFDLTPPAATTDLPPRPDGSPWPPSGGGDLFLDAIEQDLKPLVARHLPVDPARSTLFGHSFGGLFALHCLFTRPQAFASYVAASPSVWWNRTAILASETAFVRRGGPGRPTRLLVTVGSEEQPPIQAEPQDAHFARRSEARLLDHARSLAGRLAGVPDLSARFHLFSGETHGSVIPAALSLGLRFAAETHES